MPKSKPPADPLAEFRAGCLPAASAARARANMAIQLSAKPSTSRLDKLDLEEIAATLAGAEMALTRFGRRK